MGTSEDFELQKKDILIPYTLEVVEVLREIENYVRGQYLERKNYLDLKSLEPQQDVEIDIIIDREEKKEKHRCFGELLEKIDQHCDLTDIPKKRKKKDDLLDTMIVLLILGRILGYDGDELWTNIYKFVEDNKGRGKADEKKKWKKLMICSTPFTEKVTIVIP